MVDPKKVDMYLSQNSKFFQPNKLMTVREAMYKLTDEQFMMIQTVEFKDPMMMLIISFLVGEFGVDRFLLGDVLLGVLKLLSCGGAGLWCIIDLCLIMSRTRDYNYAKLQEAFLAQGMSIY